MEPTAFCANPRSVACRRRRTARSLGTSPPMPSRQPDASACRINEPRSNDLVRRTASARARLKREVVEVLSGGTHERMNLRPEPARGGRKCVEVERHRARHRASRHAFHVSYVLVTGETCQPHRGRGGEWVQRMWPAPTGTRRWGRKRCGASVPAGSTRPCGLLSNEIGQLVSAG